MRIGFFRLLLIALGTAATVIGCGASGSFRSSLPPTTASAARPAATTDEDASIERAVTQSHAELTGFAQFGALEGGFVPAEPAPGRPGYYLVNGEVVPEPPADSPPVEETQSQSTAPVPAATATPSCKAFAGNVPPPCTVTGPFRRVYSGPGHSFALAHVNLPLVTTMPPGKTPVNGDTGYVYFEGWPSPSAGNSEFGFQYSATYKYYTLYARTSNPVGYFIYQLSSGVVVHYLPGNSVTFALAGYDIAGSSYLHVAALGITDVSCGTSTAGPVHACLAHDHVPDAGWTPANCCIMARMTSIGQTNPLLSFYDGSKFGPVTWSGAELADAAPAPSPGSTTLPLTAKEPAWSGGATQSWPPPNAKWPAELNRISATDVSATGESDTIDLTMPSMKLAIDPASCKYVKSSGSIAYGLTASGSAAGITIDYGWYMLGNGLRPEGLDVPNVVSQIGIYTVSSTNIATAKIFDASSIGGFATAVDGSLWFVDALGNLRPYPTAGVSAPIDVGTAHCS